MSMTRKDSDQESEAPETPTTADGGSSHLHHQSATPPPVVTQPPMVDTVTKIDPVNSNYSQQDAGIKTQMESSELPTQFPQFPASAASSSAPTEASSAYSTPHPPALSGEQLMYQRYYGPDGQMYQVPMPHQQQYMQYQHPPQSASSSSNYWNPSPATAAPHSASSYSNPAAAAAANQMYMHPSQYMYPPQAEYGYDPRRMMQMMGQPPQQQGDFKGYPPQAGIPPMMDPGRMHMGYPHGARLPYMPAGAVGMHPMMDYAAVAREQKAAAKIPKRKDPSAPKNPKSAYLYFLIEQRAILAAQENRDFTDYTKQLGAKWRTLTDEEKEPYAVLARKDKERYLAEKAAFGNRKVFVPTE